MKETTTNKIHFFHTLNAKFSFSFFILAIAILTSSCTIGYYVYKTNIEKLYNSHAYSVAYQARSLIDGDKLASFAASGKENESYYKLKSEVETLRKNMDIISIFVVQVNVPSEGNYRYILDTLEEHKFENALGTITEYPAQYKEHIESVYYDGADLSGEHIYVNSQAYGNNFFAIVPVYDSKDQIVADLFVQCSVEKISETLRQYLTYAICFTIVTVILVLLMFLVYLNRNTVMPIKNITHHASSFLSGDNITTSQERIQTGDEIETLADALVQMEEDIVQYTNNLAAATASKEHMAAELNIAKQIQQNLFPFQFPAFPGRKDFDIYAKLKSCTAIGGNFYNFILLDDDRLCLFLGDVNGTGIPTFMLTVIATTLMGNYASLNAEPDRILESVNNQLSKNNRVELTVDAFVAIVDLRNGQFTYATAGDSIQAYLKKPGLDFEVLPNKNCFPLATIEQVHYPSSQTTLAQGDILFLHTKGISSAVNDKGLTFGSDYAKASISKLIQEEYLLKAVIDKFFKSINEFENGATQPCDSTALLFRYTGN